MDYIAFEQFIDSDVLPSPQPSLSIPLKSNIENLNSKLLLFNSLKQYLLLQDARVPNELLPDSKLAEKYARLSLDQLSSVLRPDEGRGSDDASARSEALSELLARGLNPSFGDAVMRELFTRLESKSYVDSMDLLVDAGIEGSIARKNLKTQVEAELINNFSSILADHAKPIKALKTLGDRVSALVVSIIETKDLLEKDVASSADFMHTLDSLSCEKKSIDLKKSLLIAFRQKFTLSEYEQYVLEFSDINQEFFDTLLHAERINEECLVLLALDNPQQGQNLLAKNNEFVSKANHKIATFCSRALSNIDLLNNRERLSTLHMCLKYMTKSTVQLSSVLDSFVKARSTALLDEFSSQINGSAAADSNAIPDSRPVFYSSHDPVRYTADLLAYVHSIVANEAETAKSFFDGEESLAATASHILGQVLASLAKPIKAEIDRIISVESKLQTIAQIFTHLELYHLMFDKVADAKSINTTIASAMTQAKDKVQVTLSNRLASARASNMARLDLSTDLQPPDWIIDFYPDILSVVDSMTSSTIFGLPEEEHAQFVSLIVDAPIAVFEEHLSLEASAFSKQQLIIFKLNFLDLIISKISPVRLLRLAVEKLEKLNAQLPLEAQELQLQELLKSCSLTDLYNVTNMIFPIDKELLDPSIYEAITENKLFTKETISAINEEIHTVLLTALMDTQSSLMKLNNPLAVKDIVMGAFLRFSIFYKLFSAIVVEYLHEPILSWSYKEVATMLGVYDFDLELK